MASASTSTISSDNDLCRQWIECSDDNLTADFVQQTLDQIPDNVWVTAACLDRLLEDATLQKSLLELGLKRTESAVQRARTIYESYSEADDEEHEGGRPHGTEDERRRGALASYFRDEPADAELCAMRAVLLDRLSPRRWFCRYGYAHSAYGGENGFSACSHRYSSIVLLFRDIAVTWPVCTGRF